MTDAERARAALEALNETERMIQPRHGTRLNENLATIRAALEAMARQNTEAEKANGSAPPAPGPEPGRSGPSTREQQPVAWRCEGCKWLTASPAEDLQKLRALGHISCCPDRSMRPLYAAPVVAPREPVQGADEPSIGRPDDDVAPSTSGPRSASGVGPAAIPRGWVGEVREAEPPAQDDRRDAERYRWLRDPENDGCSVAVWWKDKQDEPAGAGDELDRAIDAAMSEGRE